MAEIKITELTAETTPVDADLVAVVDVSDTTQSVNGSTNKVTLANLAAGAPFTSRYLQLAAGGASVENIGAIESNVVTVAAAGASETLDVSDVGFFDITMDQACSITFSNPAPSGDATSFVLILRGAFTPTFTNTIIWSGGVAPSYSTPSVYVFTTVNASTYFGAQIGSAFA